MGQAMNGQSDISQEHGRERSAPAAEARALIRTAVTGALATIDKASGHPYASLVTVATEPDGTPILLLSGLALHTQNLNADARASLLIDASTTRGDPLAGGRVTLIGHISAASSETARRRFLARHPAAEMYAGFADFRFFNLEIEQGHYVGGFGRIVALGPEELSLDLSGSESLVAAETEIVSHMNDDHADALQLYATRLLGGAPGAWRMTGIDPEGCDLLCGREPLRLGFESSIATPEQARGELVRLAAGARH